MVLAPLAMIVLVSFIKAYGLNFAFENFTLANYHRILVGNKMVTDSVGNSLFLGFSAGIICLFLGTMLAYVIYKVRPKGKGILAVSYTHLSASFC